MAPESPPEPTTRDRVVNLFPKSILGRLRMFCAYVRLFLSSILLVLDSSETFDIIIADQISYTIPLLRLKSPRVVFYCNNPQILQHQAQNFFMFPSGSQQDNAPPQQSCKDWYSDLMARFQNSTVFWVYLSILNLILELTLGMAHTILVSSQYT